MNELEKVKPTPTKDNNHQNPNPRRPKQRTIDIKSTVTPGPSPPATMLATESRKKSSQITADAPELPDLTIGEKYKLQAQLQKREKIIRQGGEIWHSVAMALMEIRDGRLYHGYGFTDFGRYCKERLHMGKSTVNRLINVAEVYSILAPVGAKILPSSERMLRPLLSLKQPQQKPAVWHDNIAKVWVKAVHDAEVERKPVTEKGVKIALHQLGLDPKPKDSKPEDDLEKCWRRLEATLEHERELWPAEQRGELSHRIISLVRGWEEAVTQGISNNVELESETRQPECAAPATTGCETPAPPEAEAPVPTDQPEAVVPAPPDDAEEAPQSIRRNRGTKTYRFKPLPSAVPTEDEEDIPNEREKKQGESNAEIEGKEIRQRLDEIVDSIQSERFQKTHASI